MKILKYFSFFVFIILTILPIVYIYFENVSLSDVIWVFKDAREREILIRTIYLGFGTAVLSGIIGVTTTLILEYGNIPFRKYWKVLILIPLLLPPYITSISYLMFLGKAGDFVERWEPIPGKVIPENATMPLVIPTEKTPPWYFPFNLDVYNVESAIIILSLCYFPFIFLITSFALKNINSKLEDAGRLIYPPFKVLRKITLPLILPQIIVGSLFVFIFSVLEFGVPSILRVVTTSMEVFYHFSAFFDIHQAIGLSTPLVFLIGFLILTIHFALGNKPLLSITSSFSKKDNFIKFNRIEKIVILSFFTLLLIVSVFIPVMTLLIQSKFTFFDAFMKARSSLINTLFLGILCSSLMILIGFFFSYFFRKRKIDLLIILPLIVPSAAIGIGLIFIWNTPFTSVVYGSFLILVVGYLARFLPFVIKAMEPFFHQIHPSIEESAIISGAGFFRIIYKIIFPLMKPGLLTAWFVGFVLILRELTISVLVTPPGFQTFSNRIFTLYHYGEIETVASLSLILIIMIIVPFIVFLFLNKKRK